MSAPSDFPSIQTILLNQIRNTLPSDATLADELAEILNISRDSAYRRIRGETVLSLDEVKKLHEQFDLSIDSIISPNSNMVLIEHDPVDFNFTIKGWLQSLIQKLEFAKSSSELKLIFAAKDIPLFHYFQFPELASFKLFVWLKSVIQDPEFENSLYSTDILPKEIQAEAWRAGNLFSSLPTTEIWSDEIISGTLKQIEFYHECQFFKDRSYAIKLHDHLLEFIQQLKAEADQGKKKAGGSFELYHNDILIPDNTIYGVMHNQRIVFINYNTMDLLTSSQDSFCEKTEIYMSNLIRSSALISSTAEKERNRFFNKIEKKIVAAQAKLK